MAVCYLEALLSELIDSRSCDGIVLFIEVLEFALNLDQLGVFQFGLLKDRIEVGMWANHNRNFILDDACFVLGNLFSCIA
jgi:hypothetical protein